MLARSRSLSNRTRPSITVPDPIGAARSSMALLAPQNVIHRGVGHDPSHFEADHMRTPLANNMQVWAASIKMAARRDRPADRASEPCVGQYSLPRPNGRAWPLARRAAAQRGAAAYRRSEAQGSIELRSRATLLREPHSAQWHGHHARRERPRRQLPSRFCKTGRPISASHLSLLSV